MTVVIVYIPMTFAPILPSSAMLLNWEMQVTMEKNTTGAMMICSAFMKTVLTGCST